MIRTEQPGTESSQTLTRFFRSYCAAIRGQRQLFCETIHPDPFISYEFAGIIFKMHEDTESLYIRDAGSIPFV
jgi:hypothetical protein